MKNPTLISFCVLVLFASCQNNTATKTTESKSAVTIVSDSAAIADVLHSFYTWHTANSMHLDSINFVNDKGAHNALDENQLQKYMAEVKKSGCVSDELVANETKFYQACAKIWQTESKDEVATGLEADRFLCAQDYIAPYNTGAVTSVVNGDRAQVTLNLKDPAYPTSTNSFTYEMKKENGKWLLAKLGCNMEVKY